MKTARGMGITHIKPEFEDAARLARENGLPFAAVWENALSRSKEGL